MVDSLFKDPNKEEVYHEFIIPIYKFNPNRNKKFYGQISLFIFVGLISSFVFTSFIISRLLFSIFGVFIALSLTVGPISIYYYIRTVSSDAKTKITGESYYSPGIRSHLDELRINKQGVYINLYDTEEVGLKNYFRSNYYSIPYSSIKLIYPVKVSNEQGLKSVLVGLHIETKDNRIGLISFKIHSGIEVVRVLKNYFGDAWRQIYMRDIVIPLWDCRRLQPIPKAINE